LIATGGAAPLHAGRIAQKLSIATFVVPKGAGVGSAHGFLAAPVAYEAVHSHYMTLAKFDPATLNEIFATMRREAEEIVRLAPGYGEIVETRSADMRYRGQGHDLTVELPVRAYGKDDGKLFAELFDGEYRKHFSRVIPGLGVEALTFMLTLSRAAPPSPFHVEAKAPAAHAAKIAGVRKVFDAELGTFVEASIIARDEAGPGATFKGPAVVTEAQTTTFVPSGFDGAVSAHGHLVLTRRGA
jgi:N-methylhydantoinase A